MNEQVVTGCEEDTLEFDKDEEFETEFDEEEDEDGFAKDGKAAANEGSRN